MCQSYIFLSILCFSTFFVICWTDSRIIGGDVVTDRTNYPYQVFLSFKGTPFCEGTIIDSRTILTAAVCCFLEDKSTLLPHNSSLQVIAGTLRLDDTYHEIKSTVYKIIIHRDYNNITLANNLAILKLTDELVFNDKVASIQRVTKTPKLGDSCVVSGWGSSDASYPYNNVNLLSTQVQIGDFNTCKKQYSTHNVILPSGTICDGENYKKTCYHEAGVPLVCNGALAGVVSFENGCNLAGISGVYTDIASYKDWIDSNSALSFSSHATYFSVFLSFVVYLSFSF